MFLLQQVGREKKEAIIELVTSEDLKSITKDKRFGFKWNKEKNLDLYKLRLKDSKEILGLMSLIDVPNEIRIEIHLIESSKENVGKGKVYDRIAGCLIAYACGISFDKGYMGFISLIPKTKLRKHYMTEYGMENGGKQLFSDIDNSAALMKKYL